jgi:hypothetical protein
MFNMFSIFWGLNVKRFKLAFVRPNCHALRYNRLATEARDLFHVAPNEIQNFEKKMGQVIYHWTSNLPQERLDNSSRIFTMTRSHTMMTHCHAFH